MTCAGRSLSLGVSHLFLTQVVLSLYLWIMNYAASSSRTARGRSSGWRNHRAELGVWSVAVLVGTPVFAFVVTQLVTHLTDPRRRCLLSVGAASMSETVRNGGWMPSDMGFGRVADWSGGVALLSAVVGWGGLTGAFILSSSAFARTEADLSGLW